jgi:hypothetical protein
MNETTVKGFGSGMADKAQEGKKQESTGVTPIQVITSERVEGWPGRAR